MISDTTRVKVINSRASKVQTRGFNLMKKKLLKDTAICEKYLLQCFGQPVWEGQGEMRNFSDQDEVRPEVFVAPELATS